MSISQQVWGTLNTWCVSIDTHHVSIEIGESALVAENFYKLTVKGEEVRDELIALACLPQGNVKKIWEFVFSRQERRTLVRVPLLRSVINNTPFTYSTLRKFFTGMIECVEEGYRCNGELIAEDQLRKKSSETLTCTEILNYYDAHSVCDIGSIFSDTILKESWKVPSYLYQDAEEPIEPRELRANVSNMLNTLNCSDQMISE